MAQVSNTQPYEVVCSFNYYSKLGYLLEVHAIPLMKNGELSLSNQQIHSLTAEYFGLNEQEQKAIQLLDKTGPIKLFKQFYNGKKPLKWKDWLYQELDEETLKNQIRPQIEKDIAEAFEILKNRKFFIANEEVPTAKPINILEETEILFHIRRDQRGTIYFPTFKHQDQTVEREPRENALILQEPAMFLAGRNLILFREKVDGNKLKPFVYKKFNAIPTESENLFFKEFLVGLIEEHSVYGKGITIVTEKHIAKPVLSIINNGSNMNIGLSFEYGKKVFPYHTTKNVSVYLEKDEKEYIFHRIKRSNVWERQKLDALLKLGLKHLSGSTLSCPEEMNPIEWIANNKRSLDAANFIYKEGLTSKYTLVKPELTIKATEELDWFDLEIIVKFGDITIPFKELRQYILKGVQEIPLPNGEIGVIPKEWISRITHFLEYNVSKSHSKIQIRHFHSDIINNLGTKNDSLKSKHLQLLDLGKPQSYIVPPIFKGTLRKYQETGFNWLCTLHDLQLGGILADEMGLGKTIQTLAYFSYLKIKMAREKNRKPILLVVPTSLVYNWSNEVSEFAPELKSHIYIGHRRKKDIEKGLSESDLFICTYGVLRNDLDQFKDLQFETIVIDEGQNIKNQKSATAKAVKQITAQSKFVLTGTPIENSLSDLWSQMDFANPGLLFSQTKFKSEFLVPIEKNMEEEPAKLLKNLVNPFILGRKKKQVAPELPDKSEQILSCSMTKEQKEVYEEIKSIYRNELLSKIEEDGMQKSRMHILSGLMKLRQIANHPKLINREGESGKFELLKTKIETVISSNKKVLIFSQFVEFLGMVKAHLEEHSYPFCYIDGQTNSKNREKEVAKFQAQPEIQVFLISLKAGGTGLNLQKADYVFMLDPWWNPAAEKQAEDRAHRIGQTKQVHVYKFITKDSLEEKILKLQQKKSNLSKKVIDYEQGFMKRFDKTLIDKLLK